LGREGAVSPSDTVAWAEAYLRTKWHLDPSCHLATTYKPKLRGGALPLCGRGAVSPPNAVCSGPKPTSMPCFVLIHPTVWRQYTNVTDRQDRKTYRQRSDSVWANRFTNGRPKTVHMLSRPYSHAGVLVYIHTTMHCGRPFHVHQSVVKKAVGDCRRLGLFIALSLP